MVSDGAARSHRTATHVREPPKVQDKPGVVDVPNPNDVPQVEMCNLQLASTDSVETCIEALTHPCEAEPRVLQRS